MFHRKHEFIPTPFVLHECLGCITLKHYSFQKKITEWQFGALLEITDKYSSKLDVLAIWLTVFINILGNFITILYDFKKHSSLVGLLERL